MRIVIPFNYKGINWSVWQDSNLRPPTSKAGRLTWLTLHTDNLAERRGLEPRNQLITSRRFSKPLRYHYGIVPNTCILKHINNPKASASKLLTESNCLNMF